MWYKLLMSKSQTDKEKNTGKWDRMKCEKTGQRSKEIFENKKKRKGVLPTNSVF